MAHKTKINSTAYDITGGKTLVSGTSYSIKNGKVLIGGTAYDISFVLPPAVLGLWSGATSKITCIAYSNGYWVVGGYYASTRSARIAYATSLDGTWTTKDLWSGENNNSSINSIAYGNGYWVVAGGRFANSTYYARIAYATSPNGAWTIKDLKSGDENIALFAITYANGYWVTGGRGNDGSKFTGGIYYATSPSGAWTNKTLWTGNTSAASNAVNCITNANGYWVAGGSGWGGNNTGNAYIAYATSPSGTWTTESIWTGSVSYTEINCIAYGNGYWVVGGQYYSSNRYGRIAYATSLSGTWTAKDLWNGSSAYVRITSIAYGNGKWVAGGLHYSSSTYYPRIAYATTPSGTWTAKDVWNAYNSSNNGVFAIAYANSHWVVGGTDCSLDTNQVRLAYAGSLDELGNTE